VSWIALFLEKVATDTKWFVFIIAYITKPRNEFVAVLLSLLLLLLLKNEMKPNSEWWRDLMKTMACWLIITDEFYLTRGFLYCEFLISPGSITTWPPSHLALLFVMPLTCFQNRFFFAPSNPLTSNERIHVST